MSTNGHDKYFRQKHADLSDLAGDPAFDVRGMPPNWGDYPVPHISTFAGIQSTASKVYLPSDEALRNSRDNAVYMRNDCGIMECIEGRQRATALLDWEIIPDDDTSTEQKELCAELTKILRRIRRFVEYRGNLLHAIWYGKYGIQHRYRWQNVGGNMRILPAGSNAGDLGWKPIDGDKLVLRYDDWTGQVPADQLGIRVSNSRFREGDFIRGNWRVQQLEATGQGLGYFLTPAERRAVAVHKHMIEDAPWERGYTAGSIHGVGIRSRIYWDWMQKQELLGFLIEYLERSAGGIEIWSYPQGSAQAEAKIKEAAKERVAHGRNILFFPKPLGEDAMNYDVNIVEPGMAGIDAVERVLSEYFGHRIKRYILGQTLSTEAQATGMGSGLAELHMDSFFQIITYDARNLEETLTHELLNHIKRWNFPKAKNIDVRFSIKLDDPSMEEKLEAWKTAWEMGCKLKSQEVMEAVGASIPAENDEVLENPQLQQGGGMPGMGGGMFGGPGPQGEEPPQPEGGGESSGDLNDQLMRAMFGEPVDGAQVAYSAEGGKWVQRELPFFDPGEREKIGSYKKEEDADGQWVTIGSGENGGGTPVYLKDGVITKGPSALLDKDIAELDSQQKETSSALDYQGKRKKNDPNPLHTALLQARKDTGYTMRELRQAVDDAWEIESDYLQTREAAKESARKLTGLNAGNIARLENTYSDLSKRKHFDQYAREVANQFPGVFNDFENPAPEMWELLREGKSEVEKHSPEIISTAIQLIESRNRRRIRRNPDLDSVPFSRQARVRQVNRMSRRFSGEGKLLFSRALHESRGGGNLRDELKRSQGLASQTGSRELQSVINTLYGA